MKGKLKYWIAGAALAVCGAVFLSAESPDFKLGRNMEILVNLFRDINMFYVDETDPDKLLKDAAMGLTYNLDPYTEWMPAETMQDFQIMTTGKYGGMGSMIRKKGDYTVIAQPYEGSPADKAGLQIGDRLVAVDGVNVVGMESDKVSALLKGDPGTQFRLTVLKLITGREETIDITREKINISGVPYYGMLDDSVGYIKHKDFSEDCSEDLRRAFLDLRDRQGMRALVLDYRGNGGGILQEAVKILSMFVPRGTEVVSMRGRGPESSFVFKTENEPIDLNIPIVVLTGIDYRTSGSILAPEISASAAEIVSGALQDLDRAVLVGQRTYGKGLVQSTRPVGYNSYLKITTAKYYIPSGRCIQAIDYAHRDEDGSVSFVPDSLINEFSTANGRKVYDGGGIMPDIKVDPAEYSLFSVIVQGRGYIEDFCDEYTRRNPAKPDLRTFAINDRIYGEFVRFMADKDVEYQSRTKLSLEELRKNAERELYYDGIKDEIDRIGAQLRDDKDNSLKLYREQLGSLILDNLILRHYYARGVTAYYLTRDEDIREALAVLDNRARYRTILETQDTSRK